MYFVAPKRLSFRMMIPSDFHEDWDLFNRRCKIEGMTPSELLFDLVTDYLDDYREELAKAEGELDEVAGPLRDEEGTKEKKRVKVQKPKKKSFVAKKAVITKPSEDEVDEYESDIRSTPKFRLLNLVRTLDVGDGILPDELLDVAMEEGIPNPRLQMDKLIRRGILYVHLSKVHVA